MRWLWTMCLLGWMSSPSWAGSAIIRDFDFAGPDPVTSRAYIGYTGADWQWNPFCSTCSTRSNVQFSPQWQSCIWRVVWNPLDTGGGVALSHYYPDPTFPKVRFAQLAGFGPGVRTDSVDVTATMTALANHTATSTSTGGVTQADTNLLMMTHGTLLGQGVQIYSSRIHCVSTNQSVATPTAIAPTPTVTPNATRVPFSCPR